VRGRLAETNAPDVLLVAENGGPGGIGRYCVDLAGIMGDRAAIVCLCPTPCLGATCWLAGQCKRRGVRLMTVPMPPKAWRVGLVGLVGIWKRAGRPMIHVNGRRGNAVAMVARLSTPGFRYVTTVHGVLGLHARRNAIYRLVDLVAGRVASAVVAVSADTKARLVRAGISAGRTYVVPNGLADVDLRALQAVAERRWCVRRDKGPLRIGFLGRLSPEKGTHELIRMASRLHESRAAVTIAIAGDGPDRDWMEMESKALRDHGFVSFLGVVDDAQTFLAGVDVLVLPSHNEGMPYALLEAMAAGCAIVAFAAGGIPEVVCDPSLGFLVRSGDIDGFVAAVRRLAEQPAEVESIGRAASDHVLAHYRLESRVPLLSVAYGMPIGLASGLDDPTPDAGRD
jgi:glycosyltransferase involved in cell wall biosynthesis